MIRSCDLLRHFLQFKVGLLLTRHLSDLLLDVRESLEVSKHKSARDDIAILSCLGIVFMHLLTRSVRDKLKIPVSIWLTQ